LHRSFNPYGQLPIFVDTRTSPCPLGSASPIICSVPATPQTLLCAAISGNSKARTAADRRAAEAALADCIDLLRETVKSCGGRLLRTMADRILAFFATPDAAAGAAAKMHAAVAAMPPFSGTKLGVRIAFHSGPVTAARADQSLKVVLRLTAQAKSGQVLTTQSTAGLLSTSFRAFSRQLQASPLGDTGPMAGIYEVSSPRAPARGN
jgi:adenylate cyclase